MKTLFCLLPILLTFDTAIAGGACPSYHFIDVGSPDWVDNSKVIHGLQSKSNWFGISLGNFPNPNGIGAYPGISVVHQNSPAHLAGATFPGRARTNPPTADKVLSINGQPIRSARDGNHLIENAQGSLQIRYIPQNTNKEKTISISPRRRDPLVAALFKASNKQDCHGPALTTHSPLRKPILKAVFGNGRRFRCQTAHKHLQRIHNQIKPSPHSVGNESPIVVVRGTKRVLLSLVAGNHGKTICVPSQQFDGSKLTEKSALALHLKLTAAYTSHQHRYP